MAQVSNLHFGLSAWAAGTFTVGQRCANAGNAYQCTTGGSSTTAPTGTGTSISGGAGTVFKFLSSVDYTTPQAWANALPGTLTQPVQLLVWNDAPITTTSGTPFLSLSGHTTTTSNNITITPAPGEGFAGSPAGPNLVPNSSMSGAAAGSVPDPFSADFSSAFGGGSGTPTAGTDPTGMLFTTSPQLYGVVASIVGVGTDATTGNTYVQIKFTGQTSQSDLNIYFTTLNGVPIQPNTNYTQAIGVSVVGGTTTNVSGWGTGINWLDSGNNYISSTGVGYTPTASQARFGATGTSPGNAAFASTALTIYTASASAAINVTIQVELPQLSTQAIGGAALAFNSANGVSFVQPATGAGGINYFAILDTNVVIQGIQFQDPNPSSNSSVLSFGAGCTVQDCIIDGYSQPSGAYMVNPILSGASTSVYKLFNNLIVDRAPSNATTSTISGNYSGIIANNTFVAINAPAGLNCVTDTSSASGVTIGMTNNILLGYPTAASVLQTNNASTVITAQYNLCSAPSFTNTSVVTGAGNIFSAPTTGQFVSPTTNFRLLTASQAFASGFTDTADIPAANDIYGTPRIGPWDIGAYQVPTPTSVGTGGGHASGAAVSSGPSSVGTGGGHASGAGVATGIPSVGTGGGHASGAGVSLGTSVPSVGTGGGHASGLGQTSNNIAIGTGGGQASGQGFDSNGAITATVTLNNPGAQLVNTQFTVTGTFTLTPDLQVADDTSTTFTPIPASGISALGTTQFQFVHPGLPTTGTYNLLVEDLSTDASAAVNYAVTATPPPPPPPVPVVSNTFLPAIGVSLTSLSSIIPAYVYQEYSDDPNIAAFFQAYNIMAQGYLDWMNTINLPIYTGLSGALLDWVALGLYGIQRPVLAAVQYGNLIGPFNTYQQNQIPINTNTGTTTATVYPVTDDIFKRIITWNFYRGDGTAFTVTWLKRRVMRFLAGVNGTDYTGPATQVSVQFTGTSTINVTISAGSVATTMAVVLQAAVLSNVVQLPFQYTFNVLV